MAAKGLYRTKMPESGAEYAFVDYGVASSIGEIPRSRYEEQGYQPPFDRLPTKEAYEKANSKDA
jgi:hypothetical protein